MDDDIQRILVSLKMPLWDQRQQSAAQNLANFALLENTPDGPISIPAEAVTQEMVQRIARFISDIEDPDQRYQQMLAVVLTLSRLGNAGAVLGKWAQMAGEFVVGIEPLLEILAAGKNPPPPNDN